MDLLNSIYSKDFEFKSSKEAWTNTQCAQCTGNCWGAEEAFWWSHMVCLLIMLFIHFCINLIVYQLFLLVLACLSIRIFLSNWCLNQIFLGKPEDPVFSVMHKGNSYKLWWRPERLTYRWRIETSLYGVHSGKCIAPCSFLLIELSKIFGGLFL